MNNDLGKRARRAAGALLQGFLFVPLFTATGALIAFLVCEVWPRIDGAFFTSTALCFGAALFLFSYAVAAPVGKAQFLAWFFSSVFLEQLSIGITVAFSVATYRLVDADDSWLPLAVGFSTYATTHVIFGILIDDAVDLEEQRVGGGEGLSTFEDVVRRSNLIGRVRHGPAPDQGESNWQGGWRLFDRQHKRARGGFYDSV